MGLWLILSIIELFPMPSYSAENVTGAFGYKYGDKLADVDILETKGEWPWESSSYGYNFTYLVDKTLWKYYVVKPKVSSQFFDEFFVSATPKTNLIYAITGHKSYPLEKKETYDSFVLGEKAFSRCKKDQFLIHKFLLNKYGDFEITSSEEDEWGIWKDFKGLSLKEESKEIKIQCYAYEQLVDEHYMVNVNLDIIYQEHLYDSIFNVEADELSAIQSLKELDKYKDEGF